MDCLSSCLPSLARRNPISQKSTDVVNILFAAEKPGEQLKADLNDVVGTNNWTENLAKAILNKLEQALKEGKQAGTALGDALQRSIDAAAIFTKEHPDIVLEVMATIIAIGVLVWLAPSVVEALGFGGDGPIGGTFAAAWQSRYAGYVPKRSLFSFFQRLGMKFHH